MAAIITYSTSSALGHHLEEGISDGYSAIRFHEIDIGKECNNNN